MGRGQKRVERWNEEEGSEERWLREGSGRLRGMVRRRGNDGETQGSGWGEMGKRRSEEHGEKE